MNHYHVIDSSSFLEFPIQGRSESFKTAFIENQRRRYPSTYVIQIGRKSAKQDRHVKKEWRQRSTTGEEHTHDSASTGSTALELECACFVWQLLQKPSTQLSCTIAGNRTGDDGWRSLGTHNISLQASLLESECVLTAQNRCSGAWNKWNRWAISGCLCCVKCFVHIFDPIVFFQILDGLFDFISSRSKLLHGQQSWQRLFYISSITLVSVSWI